MRKVVGGIFFFFGVLLMVWVVYALATQPEAVRDLSPIPAIIFSVGLLAVGAKWLRG